MEIELPKKDGDKEKHKLINPQTITVIGANGAGKTRFGHAIESKCENTYSLSAIQSLTLTDYLDGKLTGESLGRIYRDRIIREGDNQHVAVTEFDQLLYLLLHEEYESLVAVKEDFIQSGACRWPNTRLDTVQIIWEKIFPQNRIVRRGTGIAIMAAETKNVYNTMEMSKGEQVVFYLIGAALYAPQNSVIVVEDPEIYLHRSIISSLWDEIENARKDCVFIYLTHDLDFAASRLDGVRIWVKSYNAECNTWNYEVLENKTSFPEEVYLALLGSRKPILFVEGTDNTSIDGQLYPLIFPQYLVKPLGSCNKVIEVTRTFTDLKNFHHLDSKGIVDRDRRTDFEIKSLRERSIYVPNVAEVENLLMLEEVIRTVAHRLLLDDEHIFLQVKQNIIHLFDQDLDAQALLHTRHRLKTKITYMIDRRLSSIDELELHIETLTSDINTRSLFEDIQSEFRQYVSTKNYEAILRVYNQKSMLAQSKLTQLCGLVNKEKYLSFVISILKDNGNEAARIRKAIQSCFGL